MYSALVFGMFDHLADSAYVIIEDMCAEQLATTRTGAKVIDLVAQGPVYRGHKLALIVEGYRDGSHGGHLFKEEGRYTTPIRTLGTAQLAVRVIGNPWGLSVSELPKNF